MYLQALCGQGLLKPMAFSKAFVPAVGFGALFGLVGRNSSGAEWVFMALVAAAAVVALAQQTLP